MLGLRLDPELEAALSMTARAEGRTKSQIVRDALQRYIDHHSPAFRAEARRQSLNAARRGRTDEDAGWEAVAASDDISVPDA